MRNADTKRRVKMLSASRRSSIKFAMIMSLAYRTIESSCWCRAALSVLVNDWAPAIAETNNSRTKQNLRILQSSTLRRDDYFVAVKFKALLEGELVIGEWSIVNRQ